MAVAPRGRVSKAEAAGGEIKRDEEQWWLIPKPGFLVFLRC